ncbi:hypothetical protein [Pseudomonas sp. NPDC089734]|uniref:hypothetical protein n=1 Tax=Pseudomonas sp. NPDC089734 TaxID=3364469 RepID=UPI0037F37190
MDRLVQVTPGIIPKGYNDLSDAVFSAGNLESERKCNLVNGRVLVGFECDGSSLVLRFDNDWCLWVSVGSNKVDWDVMSETPSLGEAQDEDVFLKYPSGNVVCWNQRRFLSGLLGRQIAISPGEQYLFLFVRGVADYMFSVLVNQDCLCGVFLFISEV